MLNHQEVRIYPQAAKFLWFYYAPDDRGKSEGRAKEFPGPIDDIASDCVRELQKLKLIEVVPTFSDFGVTAKLTGLGLQVMAAQSAPDHWNPVVITDPQSNVVTTYTQVRLGFP